MILKYANTQAFIVSQDNNMVSKQYKFSSYKHGLHNIWNLYNLPKTKPPPI